MANVRMVLTHDWSMLLVVVLSLVLACAVASVACIGLTPTSFRWPQVVAAAAGLQLGEENPERRQPPGDGASSARAEPTPMRPTRATQKRSRCGRQYGQVQFASSGRSLPCSCA
jgi:hypothetical protein